MYVAESGTAVHTTGVDIQNNGNFARTDGRGNRGAGDADRGRGEVTSEESEGVIRLRKAQALENFKLTQDNQWDFSLAIRNSIALGWSDYVRVGDMVIRVKEHTPNWDNFEGFEAGEARAKKNLNVTVGDYNNTDYCRYKGEYEESVDVMGVAPENTERFVQIV